MHICIIENVHTKYLIKTVNYKYVYIYIYIYFLYMYRNFVN